MMRIVFFFFAMITFNSIQSLTQFSIQEINSTFIPSSQRVLKKQLHTTTTRNFLLLSNMMTGMQIDNTFVHRIQRLLQLINDRSFSILTERYS